MIITLRRRKVKVIITLRRIWNSLPWVDLPHVDLVLWRSHLLACTRAVNVVVPRNSSGRGFRASPGLVGLVQAVWVHVGYHELAPPEIVLFCSVVLLNQTGG